ncbi:MAG: hypothetical protein AAGD01_18670 [Acidobacteriota bacterium]
MAEVTRRIGLSLGADICWPLCYEEIVRRLDLSVPWKGDTVQVEVERVTIEPFDIRQPCRYDVVLDRLTHWYYPSREWIKKSILMDQLYVLNNPWSVQSMEKATTYAAIAHLGFPVPETWLVPQKEYEPSPDLEPTLARYARLFDLDSIGETIGYPLFIKPYDGGAWVGVNKIDNAEQLHKAYNESGKRLMHLQKAVLPHDLFVRCVGLGPQVKIVRYDPSAPLHDRYTMETPQISADERQLLEDMTLTINTFFGWDFNSCESLRADGVFHPIDFANACPDSQVTSLHYHFPWLIRSKIAWSLYCAVTGRKMLRTVDWEPYYQVLEQDLPYRERVAAYAAIARERLEVDRFEDFQARHLLHLDEIVWEFFGSETAKNAVRQKVSALYPDHEIEPFTELFWGRIQHWRETEGNPG